MFALGQVFNALLALCHLKHVLFFQVYTINLFKPEDGPLKAYIKVPKLTDAQLAICKVNDQQIFGTTVIVTFSIDKDKDATALRSEVTSVLKEAPFCWMPVAKFHEAYSNKYPNKTCDLSKLCLMPDLFKVISTPGKPQLHTRGVGWG